ncbi:MAG: CRISPR-associated endoribonuclease Cas6 [Bacteroidia bacterium]|nr:MAG: CRISPR-associated endoribonuclease Cas6 [Bacteroidia bacterium]
MRIQVRFTAKGAVRLPWRYPELLMGVFYRWVHAGNFSLGQRLHSEGFEADGHRYKGYTFSWLRAAHTRSESQGLRLKPPFYWQVSSPLSALIEALIQGIWKEPQVALGRALVQVERVEVLSEHLPAEGPIRVRTLSPIVVSTIEVSEDGRKRKVFLSPDDRAFSRILWQNLCRKAQALGKPIPTEEGLFLPVRTHSRLIQVHNTHVRAYAGEFLYQGPIEVFQIGYQAGFGERNGQGFGMVEVVKKSLKRQPR